MNRQQMLLGKLAEEAAEVAQIALKSQLFGLTERCVGLSFNNAERTHQELDDLMAIIEMLNEECGFGYVTSPQRIAEKKAKVNLYAVYAQSLGTLDTGEDRG